ncbi:MAG: YdcF family protein [Bacillota bacterium]
MRKLTAVIIGAVAVILFTSSLWLSAFGRYLVIDEQPAKSDAIVILGGETVPRVAKGVELYKDGYGGLIIMSGGGRLTSRITEADLMRIEAVDLGVSPDVVVLENKSESTYENAVYVKEIVLNRGIKSVIVVTSNYHTRRSRDIFRKVFNNTGVQIATVSAPDPKFDPGSWWTNSEGQQKALTELANTVVYTIKY